MSFVIPAVCGIVFALSEMIKPEVIERIRQETDIVELIGSYLPLKKSGRYYRTLCPFHIEKAPSFYVSQERQVYHCFGCGAGGSAITFVMNYEKVTFPEAAKLLAQRLGISLEFDTRPSPYKNLYDTCEYATKFFEQQLDKSELAKRYIVKRNIKPETVKRFRLGFAPSGNLLLGTAKKDGFSFELLLKAGLISENPSGFFDWFYDRLIFPIFSISGKVIGFGGRSLTEEREPKYLNSSETEIFKKGENLYGLFQAKSQLREKTPIVVEGYFDLLSLVDKGIEGVVAPLGTAITYEQALILRRFSSRNFLLFDGDRSGQVATRRAIEIFLKANLEPLIILLPEGFDPDKYILKYHKEGLETLLAAPIDFISFLTKERSLESVTTQKELLNEILALLGLVSDEILSELYLNRVSTVFKVNKEILRTRIIKRESKTTGVQTQITKNEEQLVQAMAMNQIFARLGKAELPVDALNDNELRNILSIIYEHSEKPGFGLVLLLDLIEDENLKKRVSSWGFISPTQFDLPEKDFLLGLKELKAKFIRRAMAQIKDGEKTVYERLEKEHYALRKEIDRLRSQAPTNKEV